MNDEAPGPDHVAAKVGQQPADLAGLAALADGPVGPVGPVGRDQPTTASAAR
ncbi:hypothetical protein ACFYQT_06310 [Streptomyces tibetensis]|uniref:Uncharacterized protein n=1 Tax=Streptomyces tibetensis TaxID=2382123 RepID=A0ABW6MU12_9ACTN